MRKKWLKLAALIFFLFGTFAFSDAQSLKPVLFKLKDIKDVSKTAATDGQYLKYVSSTGLWTPATISGALGDVVGPSSATDNAIARFDLTTGKLLQNSGALVDDNGAVLSIIRVSNYTTTPITVSASDVKKSIVTNLGAGASIEYDLPAATVGMTVTFFVEAAYTMVLDPNGTDQIMILTNAAGDSLTSDAVVGTFMTLVALQANKWYPAGYNGAWTDTN